jgi:oxygen-dependent protoporphyrinogen oxidase
MPPPLPSNAAAAAAATAAATATATATTTVLGAGLSGLAVASRLSSSILLEAAPRVGGWVNSSRRPDGALFESGPHSLRMTSTPNARALQELLAGLNLQPLHASADSKTRRLWVDGQLVELPSTLRGALANPLTRSLPFSVLRDVLGASPPPPPHDETVHEFASRKFGAQVADVLVNGFIAGVYAGDSRKLSSAAVFRDLVARERVTGSALRPSPSSWFRARPKPSTLSFPQGMMELVAALEARLGAARCELRLGEGVGRLERAAKGGGWHVTTTLGRQILSKRVVSTLPLHAVQAALPAGFSPLLDELAASVEHVSVAVVNLRFAKSRPPLGFGHLVARPAEQAATGVLGVIYDSVAFPAQQLGLPDGGCVLSVMLGGAHAPWVVREAPAALVDRAAKAARAQLGLPDAPVDAQCALHVNCIPQFSSGHLQRAMRARQELADADLTLLGTGVLGVGIVDAVGGALRQMQQSLRR